MRNKLVLGFLIWLVFNVSANDNLARGLPDFSADRFNTVKDYLTGEYLTPELPGKIFEWPTVSPVDWNGDGLFDLLVGYNLREPDVIRMVVYINQGSVGNPAFTGKNSPETCFYVEARYAGEKENRIFENDGYHVPHHPHKFLVHQTAPMDFDNDGLFDILLSEGILDLKQRRGQWYLRNIGKPEKPEFVAYYLHDPKELEKLPAGPYLEALRMFLSPPFNPGIHAFSMVDWNSDGIADFQYSRTSTYLMFGTLNDNNAWGPRDTHWLKQQPTDQQNFGPHPHMSTADFNSDGTNELLVAHPYALNPVVSNGFFSLFEQDQIQQDRFTQRFSNLFSLNSDDNPLLYPDLNWPFLFTKSGWWYPRVSTFDFDEDGDMDVIAGWGGGNDQRQYGDRIYLYRSK